MEPECISCINIYFVSGYYKWFAISKLDCSTVKFTVVTLNRVIGNNKICCSALKVDTACIIIKLVVIKRNFTACTLWHECILRICRSIECAVFNCHIYIKILIAVQISVKGASVKFISCRMQRTLICCGRHRRNTIKCNILALQCGVYTFFYIPPVIW